MPDFPRGATASEVWAYATRELSGDSGNIIRDAVVSDATKIPGGNVDAAISTRSTLTQAQILSDATPFAGGNIANLDAAITSRSSHAAADIWGVAARTITALTGTPRTDLMGEDATFEAGTGARKARIDATPAYETAVETSVLMNGTEQTLVEKTDNKQGILEGYVDLTPMVSGNVIVIRQWMKVKAAGAYVKYAEETYTGAQTIPLLYIVTKAAKTAVKVTAQQTDATYKTLDCQFYRRLTV